MALFHGSLIQAAETTGLAISGAIWKFYLTGTSTPATVYSNSTFATSLGTTVTANSAGRFVPIYLNDAVTYRAVLCNAAGTPISPYDIDPVSGDGTITATLALSSASALLGHIHSGTGPVATNVQSKLRERLDFESDFTANGNGSTDNKSQFDLFRSYVAALQGGSPGASVSLDLRSEKTYASRDSMWLLGLNKVIINGNGAHFKNIVTAGQSPFALDQTPIIIGALGYVDSVTTMMSGKGYALNYIEHYRINTAARGDTSVTTTTAANAGNFAAGNFGLICAGNAYVGGSPPAMHFHQYAKLSAGVAGTGVVPLDGSSIRNAYSATLDNTLLSGDFGSAARIFKLHSSWDCDITVNDLNVDASTNFPGYSAYAFGRRIKLNNCRLPGIAVTLCETFHASDCVFENTTAFEPVDKLVAYATFENCTFISSSIGGDGSGGQHTFKGCHFFCDVRALKNVTYEDCTFYGYVKVGNSTRCRFINCNGVDDLFSTDEAVVLTVDGATITATATTIVVPRSSILTGTTLGQFYAALTVGCRIDVVSDTTGNAYRNGHWCRVTSITDVGANLVIGVNYSGGVLIAPGTIFRAPRLLSYHGQGNFGSGAIISNTAPQSTTGIPNGGLDDVYGNNRRFLIDPLTGETFDNAAYPASGIPKRIWVNVKRAYTGATHATLGLEFLGVQPTAAQYERIDLKTVGVREAFRSSATAALGADTWAVLPATYTGRFRLVINVAAAGAGAALAEATQLLPIVELLVEFEDVAHSVAVAS